VTESPSDLSGSGACAPLGWTAHGVSAGIKTDGRLDVGAFVSEHPATAAAVFTTNLVRAAPVLVSEEHLLDAAARAVIVSSGNANAATGDEGIRTARAMCKAAADAIGCEPSEVLIAQTGLIGIPLDHEVATLGAHAAAAGATRDGGLDAADAMLTTDTVRKTSEARFRVSGVECTVGGTAKGAAMLAPSMATMLAVVTSDASVAPEVAAGALTAAMTKSFHSIVVDACRSTNDTVFLLANGASGADQIDSSGHPAYPAFAGAVEAVCRDLAVQMVRDAEGATKLLTLTVRGARSDDEAAAAARAVVSSLLVKCSLAGEDPYWGRILSELGASGASFDPADAIIRYGAVTVCAGGVAAGHDDGTLAAYMTGREITVECVIGTGPGAATFHGCDLTHAYVDENSGTS